MKKETKKEIMWVVIALVGLLLVSYLIYDTPVETFLERIFGY